MSTNAQWSPLAIPLRGMDVTPKALQWYAVHTRARHEKVVAQRLQEGGVATFLPVVTEEHRWSDRKKLVEVPLFSCYVFVQLAPTSEERARVLNIDSVLQFVGIGGQGTPIPSSQIDAVRTLMDERILWSCHPYLKVGQRVRIRSGALNGLEGILVERSKDRTLVLSVDAIQRSLAVRIEGYQVEPV